MKTIHIIELPEQEVFLAHAHDREAWEFLEETSLSLWHAGIAQVAEHDGTYIFPTGILYVFSEEVTKAGITLQVGGEDEPGD